MGKDMVSAIVYEFEQYAGRMEAGNARHDRILGELIPSALTVEGISQTQGAGWIAYRMIRQHFESCKIYLSGLRCFMAVHYLPGSNLAYPNLPDVAPADALSYALSRACDPVDIMRVSMDSSPASFALNQWGQLRGEVAERVLVDFAVQMEKVTDTLVVPLHQVAAITLESAKVLMEMQAGTVIAFRARNALNALRTPTWLPKMRHVSQVMRGFGLRAVEEYGEGESIANGCSNLIGSMVRTADDWSKILERERGQQGQPQGYVSSDRWLSTPSAPTPLDHLLSEMFGYSQ